MDWKDILAIFIAAALASVGAVSGRCSNEMFMISSGIVGGVFGRARAGADNRKVHAEIYPPPPPPPGKETP